MKKYYLINNLSFKKLDSNKNYILYDFFIYSQIIKRNDLSETNLFDFALLSIHFLEIPLSLGVALLGYLQSPIDEQGSLTKNFPSDFKTLDTSPIT